MSGPWHKRATIFDWLLNLISGSPWAYLVVPAIVAVDAFFPVLPGETSIITASLLASKGSLWIVLLWPAAFAGVVIGDNISYFLGATLGGRATRRFFRSDRSRRWLDWARRQLRLRGRGLIVGGRFIPGARTALTFAAGTLGMSWRRFIAADCLGAALFTSVYTMLGYLGGEVFTKNLWLALLIALAIAGLITAGAEVYRRLWLDRDEG